MRGDAVFQLPGRRITNSVAGRGIRRVEARADFSEALNYFEAPPLIQEVVSGEDLELTLLCVHGEPIAGSSYVSLRNAPLPFGPPIACRTFQDDELMDVGKRLLEALRFHGVAHLDFRRDLRDGRPKLLDFNARLAGTNEISTASGINFPVLLYKLALDENPDPCFESQSGLEFRWLVFGEVRHFLQTSQKVQVVKEHFKWRNVRTNLWPTDPLPPLAHALELVKGSYDT